MKIVKHTFNGMDYESIVEDDYILADMPDEEYEDYMENIDNEAMYFDEEDEED